MEMTIAVVFGFVVGYTVRGLIFLAWWRGERGKGEK